MFEIKKQEETYAIRRVPDAHAYKIIYRNRLIHVQYQIHQMD